MKKLFFLFLLLTSSFIFSQVCGNERYIKNKRKLNPQYEKELIQKVSTMASSKSNKGLFDEIITIPVVFNLVYPYNQPRGVGANVSDSDIEKEIEKLNKAFSGEYGQHIRVDTKIRFCLARNDIFGINRVGINRYSGEESYQPYISDLNYSAQEVQDHFDAVDQNLKQNKDINFPSGSFLNVWIVDLKNDNGHDFLKGYSSFPFDLQEIDPNVNDVNPLDGIVLDYAAVSDGDKSLIHEAGHWLGLFHTFQNLNIHLFNAPLNSCEETNPYTEGDLVYDTDPMDGSIEQYDNIVPGKSCIGYDCDQLETKDVQNFMYYYNDDCLTFFSQGQKERIRDVLNQYRPFISSNTGNHCDSNGLGNPTGGGSLGGGGGVVVSNSCYQCFVPSLKVPKSIRPANFYGYPESSDFKGDLYVTLRLTKDSRNSFEVRALRRDCGDLKLEFFQNLNYDTSDYRIIPHIIDNNTFVTHTQKRNGDTFAEVKVFKKINNQWTEVKTLNTNGLSFFHTNHSSYLYNQYPQSSRKFYRFDFETNLRTRVYGLASDTWFTSEGYRVKKNRGLTIEQWKYNGSGSYYLSYTDIFPLHPSYENSTDDVFGFRISKDKKYAFSSSKPGTGFKDLLIYKKINNQWVLHQEIKEILPKYFNVDMINDEYFMLGGGGSCGFTKFFKKNTNGIFEQLTDFTHLTPHNTSNTNEFLLGNYQFYNDDLKEIMINFQILKLSDILQNENLNNIDLELCGTINSSSIASKITIGGNCSAIINSPINVLATDEIIIKPSTVITSENTLLGVSDTFSSTCGFDMSCIIPENRINDKIELQARSHSKKESEEKTEKKLSENHDLSIIYPNPSKSGRINIREHENITQLRIYSMSGNLIYVTKEVEPQMFTNISKGIYIFKLFLKNGEIVNNKVIFN